MGTEGRKPINGKSILAIGLSLITSHVVQNIVNILLNLNYYNVCQFVGKTRYMHAHYRVEIYADITTDKGEVPVLGMDAPDIL